MRGGLRFGGGAEIFLEIVMKKVSFTELNKNVSNSGHTFLEDKLILFN
jgi:hypothetical protein